MPPDMSVHAMIAAKLLLALFLAFGGILCIRSGLTALALGNRKKPERTNISFRLGNTQLTLSTQAAGLVVVVVSLGWATSAVWVAPESLSITKNDEGETGINIGLRTGPGNPWAIVATRPTPQRCTLTPSTTGQGWQVLRCEGDGPYGAPLEMFAFTCRDGACTADPKRDGQPQIEGYQVDATNEQGRDVEKPLLN